MDPNKVNPSSAPKSLPILTSTKFVPKKGFQMYRRQSGPPINSRVAIPLKLISADFVALAMAYLSSSCVRGTSTAVIGFVLAYNPMRTRSDY